MNLFNHSAACLILSLMIPFFGQAQSIPAIVEANDAAQIANTVWKLKRVTVAGLDSYHLWMNQSFKFIPETGEFEAEFGCDSKISRSAYNDLTANSVVLDYFYWEPAQCGKWVGDVFVEDKAKAESQTRYLVSLHTLIIKGGVALKKFVDAKGTVHLEMKNANQNDPYKARLIFIAAPKN